MKNHGTYFKGLIPPPIIFTSLLLLGFTAQWLYPVSLMFPTRSLRLLAGLPVLTVSGLIAVNAALIMRKNKTDIIFRNPTTKFIRQGSFRFTRNPLYLSLLLVMGSIAVFANSAWHVLATILLFFLLNFHVIAREEKFLESRFGEEYIQYKKSVRRWI